MRSLCAALVSGVVLGVAMTASGTAPGAVPAQAGEPPAGRIICHRVDHGFTPTSLRIPRREARYGLETLCIGGGQGIAAVFERVALHATVGLRPDGRAARVASQPSRSPARP